MAGEDGDSVEDGGAPVSPAPSALADDVAEEEARRAKRAAEDQRRSFRTQHVAAGLARITRPVFQRHGKAAAALLADWPDIVGPELARLALPVKLTPSRRQGEGGTLTLRAAGAAALELQHRQSELIARINAFAGRPLVTRIALSQTGPRSRLAAPTPAAALRQPDRPPPLPPSPRARAAARASVSAALAEITDPELKAALQRLGERLA